MIHMHVRYHTEHIDLHILDLRSDITVLFFIASLDINLNIASAAKLITSKNGDLSIKMLALGS